MVNARAPRIVNLQGQKPQEIEQTLKVLERPRLRVSFRVILAFTHFIITALTCWALSTLSGNHLPLIAWIGITLAVMLIVLAFEFLCERLVLRDPELWAVRLHKAARLIDWEMAPFSWLMTALHGNLGAASANDHIVTEEELKTWVETEQPDGGLEEDERRMIYSIFQFGDTLCREIMVPRTDVLALEVDTPLQLAMDELINSGHSRVPVFEDSIDNVIGLLYAKDLLKITHSAEDTRDLHQYLRPAYFVPESKKVDELLAEMQAKGMHLAVVVDEYGGMAGVVTLEDIVEEIVGEIRDEYDEGEELAIQKIAPDEYIFKGQISLGDVNELLGTALTAELADSLGGFLLSQMGRVPQQGDTLQMEGWTFVVEEIHEHRIGKVRARKLTPISIEEQRENNG